MMNPQTTAAPTRITTANAITRLRQVAACTLSAAALLLAGLSAARADALIDTSRLGSAPVVKSMRTFRDLRFREVVPQHYDFSCGSAALATLLLHGYGYDEVTEAELIKRMMQGADPQLVIRNGFSMLDMKRYVESVGLRGRGFRIEMDSLYRLKMPVITLMDIRGYKHFVVVKGADAGRVFIADPALGHRVVLEDEFVRSWNGIVFAVLADRPLRSDSYLVNSRTSPALQRRLDALGNATAPPRVVEFGLVVADLF